METEAPEVISSEIAYSAQVRGEIDIQIATAKAYPRSIDKFKQDARSMATRDVATAEQCGYVLPPRSGKIIEGPSVRLAEIIAGAWGNLRIASRVIGIDENSVTCQAACHDLETNTAIIIEVKRRITTSKGKRYNDDMINMTANAGCAIAFRNSIFKVVPKAHWVDIYDAAMKVSTGDEKTLIQRRNDALVYLKDLGVTKEDILGRLGVKAIDDIDLNSLRILRGIIQAVKDGDTTIQDAFRPEPGAEKKESVLTPGRHTTRKKKVDKGEDAEVTPDEKPPVISGPPLEPEMITEGKPFEVGPVLVYNLEQAAAERGWSKDDLGSLVEEKTGEKIKAIPSQAKYDEIMAHLKTPVPEGDVK